MSDSQEKKLNSEQKEAVEYGNGPLLIIAGAGTGKTTVVTERIKQLVSTDKAKPSEILALTFTEKAAREMEERVDIAMPYGYTQMWISTFHSFCDRVLRADGLSVGLNPRYNLMTQAETIQFIRKNLFKFELDYYRPLGNPNKFIEGMIQHFSRLKDEDVTPNQYLDWVKSGILNPKSETKDANEENQKFQELARAYETYEKLKTEEGLMDFSDLIANTLKLFRTRKSVLSRYRSQFKYILVDEFQDTNFAQYALIKLLAPCEQNQNLTVVGDDSQSIYKFRGAAISNILQFMEDYKSAKQIILTKNYRSSQTILDASYKLIKNNDPDTLEVKLGISKNLVAIRKIPEEPVVFIYKDRVENESETVVSEIKSQKAKVKSIDGEEVYNWNDFAILVRANNHAEPFIRALSRAGIPYQFLGPGMLFQQPAVKDLIAYLKVLANFEDSVAMYRVLAVDIFEISPRDLAAISNFGKKKNLSLFESCEQIDQILVGMETREKINRLVEMIHRHLGLIPKETAGQILYDFLETTGLLKKMVDYQTGNEEKRAQNITKFFEKLKSYEAEHEDASVFTVSDWIDLSMDLGESPLATDIDWSENNAVNILTVHSAKGLEFPIVFLVNLVTQRFPTTERREQIPIPDALIKEILPVGDFHLEEERRLFYVGMTRAKDRLYFTAANFYGEGKRERKLSPFVEEALGVITTKELQQSTEKEKQLTLSDWVKPSSAKATEGQALSQPAITYISYSQIETFKQCPLHYKLRYILNIPTPPSSAQSFGTSMHAALRDYYQKRIAGEKIGEEELLELLKTNWISDGYKDKKHEQLTLEKGRKFLRSFFKQVKDSPILPLILEGSFNFPLKGIRVGGRIDRVDPSRQRRAEAGPFDGIEIIDYKTGANVPTQEDVDKDLQMTFYALAANEVKEKPFGIDPDKINLSFYYFETGEKVTTFRTKDQLQKAKVEILDWVEKIKTSDFNCNHSKMCEHCEYRLLCDTE
jgi:DNA helicase II / ATP-dependent DNA helicase PcrA